MCFFHFLQGGLILLTSPRGALTSCTQKNLCISSLSIKPKILYLATKANKNNVALSRIFLASTVLYGEVQDMRDCTKPKNQSDKQFDYSV